MNALFSSALCAVLLLPCPPACLAGTSGVPSKDKDNLPPAAMAKSVSIPVVTIPKTSPAATTHANADDDLASDPLAEDATIPAAVPGTKLADPEQEKAELASLLQTAVKAEAHPADYAATIAALQAEVARLQRLSSASPSGDSRDVPAAASKTSRDALAKDNDKNSDNAAAANEAAAELAEAQAMADAALAAQPLTAAAQTYSADEAATQAATGGGRHHGLDNFTHPNLAQTPMTQSTTRWAVSFKSGPLILS